MVLVALVKLTDKSKNNCVTLSPDLGPSVGQLAFEDPGAAPARNFIRGLVQTGQASFTSLSRLFKWLALSFLPYLPNYLELVVSWSEFQTSTRMILVLIQPSTNLEKTKIDK